MRTRCYRRSCLRRHPIGSSDGLSKVLAGELVDVKPDEQGSVGITAKDGRRLL